MLAKWHTNILHYLCPEYTYLPVMNTFKWLNLFMLLGFSFCYLEWGKDQSIFAGQLLFDLLLGRQLSWETLTHPVILSGLTGQACLLYAILVKRPVRWINLVAVILLSLLVLFLLFIGILAANPRMILSDIPFLVAAGLFFSRLRSWKSHEARSA